MIGKERVVMNITIKGWQSTVLIVNTLRELLFLFFANILVIVPLLS